MQKSQIEQLPLDFKPQTYLGKEDFMIAKCNIEALKAIETWNEWSYFALCLYGPSGSGKSHLANIFSDHVSVTTHYPYKIPNIKAKMLNLENIYDFYPQHHCLIVEDLDENVNQEALFHLYNMYRNEGGYILFTAEKPPARMNFTLPDLQSRLNIVPVVEIGEPDDELLSALVVKLFSDRQVMINPDVVTYIINNSERSFAYIRKLVEETDRISLVRKRAVSIAIVKEAIISIQDTTQGELF